MWKGKIAQAVNSSDFKNYTSRFKGLSQLVAEPTGPEIAEVEVEKRNRKEPQNKDAAQPTDARERKPKVTHKAERHVVRIKGKNVEFSHQFVTLGVKESWKKHNYTPGQLIEVFTNTDFPAYLVTKDKVFYAVIHIAEAIAEVMIQEAGEDFVNISEIKELILRKASALKDQFTEPV